MVSRGYWFKSDNVEYGESGLLVQKGFYTFKQSAHSPLFEEPEKMREIVRADVLTGSKGLADPE